MTDARRIAWAFWIIAAFMLIEVIGGLWSGSLALLADAAHMVSDSAALGFSWLALRIGQRPANSKLSFGYKRLEILAAFVNGIALFVIAGWITIEAVIRFARPVQILSGTMLWVAVAGLAANIAAFYVLNGGSRENLNMRSAWLHVMGDMLGSVAAIIAALVIRYTGFMPIDPLLSILVAALVLKSAWGIVRESAHILLEGTPSHIKLNDIKLDLEAHISGVSDVHHVHAWSMTAEHFMVTLHAAVPPGTDAAAVVGAIQARLRESFQVDHVTVQIEMDDCIERYHRNEGGVAGVDAAGCTPAPAQHVH
ncbi:cation diffusion facilitator family transporter [Silvimonas sp. JCM 19000]